MIRNTIISLLFIPSMVFAAPPIIGGTEGGKFIAPLILKESETPTLFPDVTYYKLYIKSDGLLYKLDYLGVESAVSSGGGGGGGGITALTGDVSASGTGSVAATIASGLSALKIANGTVTSTEFQYINSLTSNAQDQLDAKANTTLSNLGTTSINANLIFSGALAAPTIRTPDTTAASSKGILIQSGGTSSTSGLNSGNIQLITGDSVASGSWSGSLQFITGTGTSAGTGDISFNTGAASSSGPSGNIVFLTGTTSGTRGDISLKNGTEGASGRAWISTNATGAGGWSLVSNAHIAAAAGIGSTKIADGSVSNTEFQYINSLTSNAQDQFDAILSDITDIDSDVLALQGDVGIATSNITSLQTDVAGKQAAGNYLTALTGDATAAGPGSSALTLATVNSNVGSFGSTANYTSVTVNAKGLVTAASQGAIAIGESQVTNLVSDLAAKQASDSDLTAVAGIGTTGIIVRTGTGTATTRTLAAGSTKISLSTADGVSGNPTIDVSESNLTLGNIGGTLGATKGGTGLSSYAVGDIPYASSTTALSALAIGTSNQVLTRSASALPAWVSTLSIVQGGTNNGSLAVTAGGLLYTDGTKVMNVGIGTTGQLLQSNGGSPPSWSTTASSGVFPPSTQELTSGTTYNKDYWFVVTAGNATVGSTWTHNGVTYTAQMTIASGTQIVMSGSAAPLASGTLTKASGTGDSTLTFSTYVAPAYLEVECVGGGGGGGGGGNVTPPTGSAGGTTTFGSTLISCTGGAGGSTGNSGGGACTVTSPALTVRNVIGGQSSWFATAASTTTGVYGAAGNTGGGTPFMTMGGGSNANSAGAAGGANTGAGGAGGGFTAATASRYSLAGGGGGGYVLVRILNPSATYAYSIGTSGSNGGAGTGGFAGGAGGTGRCNVHAYYR